MGGVRARALPAGRGVLVTRRGGARVVQVALADGASGVEVGSGAEVAAGRATGSEPRQPTEKVKSRYRTTGGRCYLGCASGRWTCGNGSRPGAGSSPGSAAAAGNGAGNSGGGSGGFLPHTGLELVAVTAVGLGLLLAGLTLRRWRET